MSDFGTILKQLRKEQHVTQRELAERVKVDFTYISKMENGKLEGPPSIEIIKKLAKALNTDEDKLILSAKKVPDNMRDAIVGDELAIAFLRKVKKLSDEQRKDLKDLLDKG